MLYLDEEATEACTQLLHQLDMADLAGKVEVVWNSRMRSTAGRAFYKGSKIELNPKLKNISEEEVHRTLLHELAHLVAFHRYGTRIAPHGAEWKQACAELGIPGETATHKLPLPSRRMEKRWRYSCPVCGEGFDRVRRMKKAAGCYTCCKTKNGGYYTRKFRLVESKITEG